MKRRVGELATEIGARVVGDEQVAVSGISSIANAAPGDLVFVEEEKHMEAALLCAATAVIAGEFASGGDSPKPLLIAQNPRLAFAWAAKFICGSGRDRMGVHPRAVVHESVHFGEEVSVDALAVIHEEVSIGNRTWIGSGCVLGSGVIVGEECQIYPNVTIYSGTRLGNRVIVHAGAVLGSDGFGYVRNPARGTHEKFPQIGKLEIEDHVEIGANSTVDRGALDTTRIGYGTKIDNLVHIGHNCQIGDNVIIAAQAGFSGSITIEDNVIVGGQVGVAEHACIKEGVLLGGQSGVLPKKILRGKGIAFWGTPARPLRKYLRTLAALAKLAKSDPGE